MSTPWKSLWAKTPLGGLVVAAMMLGLSAGSVLAHDEHDEHDQAQADKNLPPHERPAPAAPPTGGHANLAEAATNPVANLMQFQVQNVFNPDNHNSSGSSNNFIIQPVIPFKLPWEKVPVLITRTTIPYVTTPDLGSPVNRKNGLGDIVLLTLATPKLKTKGMQLGLGSTVTIPTAGDNDFTGSGKWQAGPAFLYINMKTPSLQWGLFTYQQWSFATTSSGREDVSKLALQPFITKHLSNGWYIGSPDNPQNYDFKSKKMTWALGGQVGRVMKLGKLPVKLFAEPLYNPENDAGPTAKWSLKLNMTMLFPT
jgi:hypothetical protein